MAKQRQNLIDTVKNIFSGTVQQVPRTLNNIGSQLSTFNPIQYNPTTQRQNISFGPRVNSAIRTAGNTFLDATSFIPTREVLDIATSKQPLLSKSNIKPFTTAAKKVSILTAGQALAPLAAPVLSKAPVLGQALSKVASNPVGLGLKNMFNPALLATSGVIGAAAGALTGQDPLQTGAEQIGRAPGLGFGLGLTSPVLQGFGPTINTLKNPVVRETVGRGVSAGANVAEGILLNKMQGLPINRNTIGIDALVGGLMPGQVGYKSGYKRPVGKVVENALDIEVKIPVAKIGKTPQQIAQNAPLVDLANEYRAYTDLTQDIGTKNPALLKQLHTYAKSIGYDDFSGFYKDATSGRHIKNDWSEAIFTKLKKVQSEESMSKKWQDDEVLAKQLSAKVNKFLYGQQPFTPASTNPPVGFSMKEVKGNKSIHDIERALKQGQINDIEAKTLIDDVINGSDTNVKPVDPLIQEARKYKSAEDFINAQEGSEIRKPIMYIPTQTDTRRVDFAGHKSLYHETSPQSAAQILRETSMGKSLSPNLDINVSNSKDLAKGQGGQGVLIEFEGNKTYGNFSEKMKPGSEFLHKQGLTDELHINGFKSSRVVKSLEMNANDYNKLGGITASDVASNDLDFRNPIDIGNGRIRFERLDREFIPGSNTTSITTKTPAQKLTDIWNEANKNPLEGKQIIQNNERYRTLISNTKAKADKLYTESIDRFHPLSKLGKQAGKEKAIRNALTGYYGAGSTANYHVDYDLAPILKEQNIDDLRRVAIAQRDIELKSRGIVGSNKGETLEKLQAELGEEKVAQVQQTLGKLYKYQSDMVKKYLVDTGIVSQKSYEAMIKNNQAYIPYKRVMDQVDEYLGFVPPRKGAGSVGSQNVLFKIKGSDKEIIDPIESIIENTYKVVGLGKRQQVAKTIVSLKGTLPEGMITKTSKSTFGNSTISVFENGKVQKYTVPQEVADSAKGLSEEGLNTIVKILAKPTQIFRATATGYNPEFLVPNVTRDLQSSFVNAGLNPFSFIKGFAHTLKQDDVYQDFLMSGGKSTTRVALDRPTLTKTVGEITGSAPSRGLAMLKPSKILETLQKFGEYSETPTRVAVFEQKYNNAIANGLSRQEALNEAAYWAQEATVNFARRGSKTQAANALYAFLNARTQGIDRILRSVKNDPVGASIRIGLISQVPALGLYAWNRGFQSYHDKRLLSDRDKENNFILMLSDTPIEQLGGAQYIKIPKGEVGKLANPLEQYLVYADGKGGNVSDGLMSVIKGILPMDNAGDLIPTAVRPIAEQAANRSFFFGSEIVPEYKKNYPKAYQDTSYTSPTYRAIGQKTNTSPARLQALVEGYGTGIAKIGTNITDRFVPETYYSDKNKQGQDINKTPILRRFLGGEKRTQEEQTFANIKGSESIDYGIRDVKGAINRGDIPQDVGIKKIEELKQEQNKLLEQGGAMYQKGSVIYEKNSEGKIKEYDLSDDSDKEKYYKDQLKKSSNQYKQFDNTLYYKDGNSIKTIDLSTNPKLPAKTGYSSLDNMALANYKSDLNSKQKDIYKLYELGVLSQEQALAQLTNIENIKNTYTKAKKGKKITIGKIKTPKVRTIKVKLAKVKYPKVKKLKLKSLTSSRGRSISIAT